MIYILNKGGGTAKKKMLLRQMGKLECETKKGKKKKKNDSRWKEQLGARFTRVITS